MMTPREKQRMDELRGEIRYYKREVKALEKIIRENSDDLADMQMRSSDLLFKLIDVVGDLKYRDD